MIAVHVTVLDLPFISSTAVGVLEINEDWESYMLGDAGTQVLDKGVGFTGSWFANSNYFGVHGIESWSYLVGDAGTQTMNGGVGYTGSWQFNNGMLEFTGTESWQIYAFGVYGGSGTDTSQLNLGFKFTGTWYCQQDYFSIIANDDWSVYTIGTSGTQILNAGTGWTTSSGSAWT